MAFGFQLRTRLQMKNLQAGDLPNNRRVKKRTFEISLIDVHQDFLCNKLRVAFACLAFDKHETVFVTYS
jgi:hypothetical protein